MFSTWIHFIDVLNEIAVSLICASHTYPSAKNDISPMQFSDISTQSVISDWMQSQISKYNTLDIRLDLWLIATVVPQAVQEHLNVKKS